MDQEKRNEMPDETSRTGNISGAEESLSVPVIEEKIIIDKKTEETGRVRIQKKVHETEETIEIPVSTEELEVERVAVNQYIDTPPPAIRHEGNTTIIPVLQEVTVVEKRLLLVEEVRITKKVVDTATTQRVPLRKEEVTVTRENSKNKKEV